MTAICPGQQFDATYNDDLDGEGAGYNPITGVAAAYYGVNDSWIERGQCYGPGVSINYNGILHIRENDFENSAKNCLATIVISGPTPSFVDIVGNYGEMTNAQGATNPLCFLLLQTACTGEIGVNEVYGGNGVWDGDSAAINMNGSQFVGSIDTSAFNRWNKALIAGNSNQSSQWAYTGNYEDSTLRPNVQFDGGYPYINRALAAANNINLSNWGTLDFRYHRVRANRVDHAMPQSITAAGYPIMLQYSENIEINIGGTPIINCIEDAGKFPGTRVVICAMQPVVLAHNAKTAIHSVEIVEPGTLNPVLTITDSTPGTPLQAVGTVSIQNGVVTGAAVVSAPSGMIAPLSFSLAAYGFSSLSPTFSGTLDVNGNLTAITVTNGSSYGYQCTTVGGGGGRCVITANCVNGKLTGFNVASSDSNFTSAPGLVIPSSGSGVAPQGVVIRQAPFILAKGANCTILAGQAIAFYVNSAGQLVEIGNTSLSL